MTCYHRHVHMTGSLYLVLLLWVDWSIGWSFSSHQEHENGLRGSHSAEESAKTSSDTDDYHFNGEYSPLINDNFQHLIKKQSTSNDDHDDTDDNYENNENDHDMIHLPLHHHNQTSTQMKMKIRSLASSEGCFGSWPNLAQAIKIGNLMPEDAQTYILCPNFKFNLNAKQVKANTIPIVIESNDATVRCGNEFEKGHAGSCVVSGGWSHFQISGQVKNIQFIGIQFMYAESYSILATGGSLSTASFIHCTWNGNRGEAAILLYNQAKGNAIGENVKTASIRKPKQASMTLDFEECVFLDNWLSNATVLNIAGIIDFRRSLFIQNVAYLGVISAIHEATLSMDSSCFYQNLIHLPGTIFVSSATNSLLLEKMDNYGQNNSVQMGKCEEIYFDLTGDCMLYSECGDGICTEIYTKSQRVADGMWREDPTARQGGMANCPVDMFQPSGPSPPATNNNNNNKDKNEKGNEKSTSPAPTKSPKVEEPVETTSEKLNYFIDNNFMIVIICAACFGVLLCMTIVFCYGKKTAKYKVLKRQAKEEERRKSKYDDEASEDEESLETSTRKYKSRVKKRMSRSRMRSRSRTASTRESFTDPARSRSMSVNPNKKAMRDRSMSVKPNARSRSMSVNPNKKFGKERSVSILNKSKRERSMSVNPNRESISKKDKKKTRSKSKKKKKRSKSKKRSDDHPDLAELESSSSSESSESEVEENEPLLGHESNANLSNMGESSRYESNGNLSNMGSTSPQHEEDEAENSNEEDGGIDGMVNMIREDINFVAKETNGNRSSTLNEKLAKNRLKYYKRQASDHDDFTQDSSKQDESMGDLKEKKRRNSDSRLSSSDTDQDGKKERRESQSKLKSRGLSRERSKMRVSTSRGPSSRHLSKTKSSRMSSRKLRSSSSNEDDDLRKSSRTSSRELRKALEKAKSMRPSSSTPDSLRASMSKGHNSSDDMRRQRSSMLQTLSETDTDGGDKDGDDVADDQSEYEEIVVKKVKKKKKKKPDS